MNAREGIKKALNRLLRPLGAQLAGTGAERDEEARLQRLVESRHWDAARFEKATG